MEIGNEGQGRLGDCIKSCSDTKWSERCNTIGAASDWEIVLSLQYVCHVLHINGILISIMVTMCLSHATIILSTYVALHMSSRIRMCSTCVEHQENKTWCAWWFAPEETTRKLMQHTQLQPCNASTSRLRGNQAILISRPVMILTCIVCVMMTAPHTLPI